MTATEHPPLCDVYCCSQHPDRTCQLPPEHDGDHDDGNGRTWLRLGWERKSE